MLPSLSVPAIRNAHGLAEERHAHSPEEAVHLVIAESPPTPMQPDTGVLWGPQPDRKRHKPLGHRYIPWEADSRLFGTVLPVFP